MKNLLLIGIAGLSLASCKTVSKQYIIRPKSHTETQGTATLLRKKAKWKWILAFSN
jgi:Cu-Zn family superoxide dismutase